MAGILSQLGARANAPHASVYDVQNQAMRAQQQQRAMEGGQMITNELGMADPSKQNLLSAMSMIDPTNAMKMAGYGVQSRGVSGNYAADEAKRQLAGGVIEQITLKSQQIVQAMRQDSNANVDGLEDEIAMLQGRYSSIYPGRQYKDQATEFAKKLLKEREMAIKEGADIRAGEKFKDERLRNRQKLIEGSLGNYKKDVDKAEKRLAFVASAIERIKSELKNSKAGLPVNAEQRRQAAVDITKSVDPDSAVLLGEVEATLQKSAESVYQGIVGKYLDGSKITDDDLRNFEKAGRTTQKVWKRFMSGSKEGGFRNLSSALKEGNYKVPLGLMGKFTNVTGGTQSFTGGFGKGKGEIVEGSPSAQLLKIFENEKSGGK